MSQPKQTRTVYRRGRETRYACTNPYHPAPQARRLATWTVPRVMQASPWWWRWYLRGDC